MTNSLRLVRLPEAMQKTGFARSTIYAKIADGTFPRPQKISKRAVAFLEADLDNWIHQQIEATSQGGANV